MIARRMGKLDSSGIRKVFDLAAQLKDPVNLSIGQPDFDVPQAVKDAAKEAIERGLNRYTVTQGIPELRSALKEKLKREKGVEAESIFITSGVSGGLLLAFLVLFEPGDEIIAPDPYFVMYKHLGNLTGASLRFVDTYPDFKATAERLAPHITKDTKAILINSPANPTGAVMNRAELQRVADLAREHKLLIISDEIYDTFVYDEPHVSIASLCDETLLLGGFSKSHAMTGWRLGYAAGPAKIIAEMVKLQQFSFVCAPSFAQYAGLRALELPATAWRDAYRRKRDMIYDGLRPPAGGFDVQKPGGAFYIFPRVPWGTDEQFVAEAIRNNVLVIPGSVFSERNTHFRISYAAPDDTIRRGIEILNRLAAQGSRG
jgi:aspartate aminotransferase/aminotransferase